MFRLSRERALKTFTKEKTSGAASRTIHVRRPHDDPVREKRGEQSKFRATLVYLCTVREISTLIGEVNNDTRPRARKLARDLRARGDDTLGVKIWGLKAPALALPGWVGIVDGAREAKRSNRCLLDYVPVRSVEGNDEVLEAGHLLIPHDVLLPHRVHHLEQNIGRRITSGGDY